MCCFSRPVIHVSKTQMFARAVAGGRQALIYSMDLHTAEDVAMILPIPVAEPRKDDQVTFISLEDYPSLFAGLNRGFPEPASGGGDSLGSRSPVPRSSPLKVVNVGSFAASFVPTVGDFSRLDEQFRLPNAVWEKIGQYANFGFAVFKLRRGQAKIHPMAFTFPSALPGKLFFPTVHIHDGEIHPKADFDHTLYCQVGQIGLRSLATWQESELPANRFVNSKSARNLILSDLHVYRTTLRGSLANEDTILRVA